MRVFSRAIDRLAAPTAIFPAVAADRDEPGVLGNLPRSRPGRRSNKRGGAASERKPAATKSVPAPKARRSTASRPKQRTTTGARSSSSPRPQPAASRSGGGNDPVGQAVQIAGKVAAVGLKTAAGIVKRIPRP
jgi:hypothetical protein